MKHKKQRIFEILSRNAETIHIGAHCTTGIHGWFRGFLQSQEFDELSSDKRAEAFNTFSLLDYILTEIDGMGLE